MSAFQEHSDECYGVRPLSHGIERAPLEVQPPPTPNTSPNHENMPDTPEVKDDVSSSTTFQAEPTTSTIHRLSASLQAKLSSELLDQSDALIGSRFFISFDRPARYTWLGRCADREGMPNGTAPYGGLGELHGNFAQFLRVARPDAHRHHVGLADMRLDGDHCHASDATGKISFFFAGVGFFGLISIATRFPRCRLLLPPSVWLYWWIPTHSDWAIARLQAEEAQQLKIMREGTSFVQTSDPSDPIFQQNDAEPNISERGANIPIGRYHCCSEKRYGNLSINTERRIGSKIHPATSERWSVRYQELESMQKTLGLGKTKADGLLFIDVAGKVYRVSGSKPRDEVLSQIIGYSNVQWQRRG